MSFPRETQAFRQDARAKGKLLTAKEREKLLQPYLPTPPLRSTSPQHRKSKTLRAFLEYQLHILVFAVIHTVFSLYIRIRQAYHAVIDRVFSVLYYHHRTPELIKKDVQGLTRLPKHLSVILELREERRGGTGVDGLLEEMAEISAWCTCVGIPTLSVYEKTGILKRCIPTVHRKVSSRIYAYFGRSRPSVQIRAPHLPSFLNDDLQERVSSSPTANTGHLSILLLSSEDGRATFVDLTKTLSEMSQRNKICPEDISVDLIDAEISDSVMGEPDVLILFSPNVELQGYPPWQLRLTEIYHVQDNTGAGYQVFLRALHKLANAQMRFGR